MYWDKRRRNNEAAKRSRDARRAKEQETAMKAVYMEKENLILKLELQKREETIKQLNQQLMLCRPLSLQTSM